MEKVRVGIASIPDREETLRLVVDSLVKQADEIFISLNGYKKVPYFLKHRKITAKLAENLGDFQKFDFLNDFEGYYITCDDDITYGENFIEHTVEKIEQYNRKCVVGWHGSNLKENFSDYYCAKSRSVYTFRSLISQDIYVDILGTGCLGFHTDTLFPDRSVFPKPNMADVYFAIFAREKKVPLLLCEHPKEILKPLETKTSISEDSISDKASSLNKKKEVTLLAKKLLDLCSKNSLIDIESRHLNIGIIGRFQPGRWTKGGIYKSCELMSSMCKELSWNPINIEVDFPIEDTKALLRQLKKQNKIDVLLVYTGDQEAQDFFAVSHLIDEALDLEIPTAVNLSINLTDERNREILNFLQERIYHSSLFLMSFTEEVKSWSVFEAFKEKIVVFPKTIQTLPSLTKKRDFSVRRGIFLGDIAKLVNPKLSSDPLPFLKELSKKIGGDPLVCVAQYNTSSIPEEIRNLVEIIPYQDNIIDIFNRFRLYVHLQKFCTFEMLPVEALSNGLPVAYIDMPQSLNKYISDSGIRFSDVEDMSYKISYIYNNNKAWESFSQSGILRTMSYSTRNSLGILGSSVIEMMYKCKKEDFRV